MKSNPFQDKQSVIFTDAELFEIERRKQGDLSDAQGLFSKRIKPRIIELLDVWFPQKSLLRKLLEKQKPGRKKGARK